MSQLSNRPWYGRIVELLAITACVIGVLLVTASNPSYDEFAKGALSGLVAFIVSQFRNA